MSPNPSDSDLPVRVSPHARDLLDDYREAVEELCGVKPNVREAVELAIVTAAYLAVRGASDSGGPPYRSQKRGRTRFFPTPMWLNDAARKVGRPPGEP